MELVGLAALLVALRLAGWPLARRAWPRAPAAAYALSGIVGLVVTFGLSVLLSVLGGLRLGGGAAVAGGLAFTAMLAVLALWWPGPRARRPGWREALEPHAVWAAALLLALAVVAANPQVDPDSERFMDMAMLRAYVVDGGVPAEDPWFAGSRVAYYDGGYVLLGWLAAASGSDPRWFFNLAVALVYATAASGIYAVGRALGGGRTGLWALFLVMLAGPPDALHQLLTTGQVDWFGTARVIPDTITEFPFFSLVWADLHPYFMALVLWPPLLLTGLEATRETAAMRRPAGLVLAALLLGTLGWVHTWDLLPMGLLWCVVGWRGARGGARPWRSFACWCLPLVGGAALAALALVSRMPGGAGGPGRVEVRTEVGDWLSLWGVPAVLYAGAGLVLLRRQDPQERRAPLLWLALAGFLLLVGWTGLPLALVLALAAAWLVLEPEWRPAWVGAVGYVAFLLLALIEVLFVDDFYGPPLERMNTVFKVVMHAWVLLGVGGAWLLTEALAAARRRRLAAALSLALVVLVVGGAYPFEVTGPRTVPWGADWSLDSERSIDSVYPDDAEAIRRLREGEPRGRLLEWPGDPYSWGGRFATFTGWPTLVGWAHHEAGWRGDWAGPMERRSALEAAYRSPSPAPMQELIQRHGIRYLVVGALERQAVPPPALAKLAGLGRPVVEVGQTVVYRVDEVSP